MDDPCIKPTLYPYKEFENNDNILVAMTNRGGHCGHLTGNVRPYQWHPKFFMEFLDFVETKSKKLQ